MPTNRHVTLQSRPDGSLEESDFAITEQPVPKPENYEIVYRTLYLSVDPSMRLRMPAGSSYSETWDIGDTLRGRAIAEVVESRHPEFSDGDKVVGMLDWSEYGVVGGETVRHVDTDGGEITKELSVLGMTGRTAYFGVLDIGQPRPGDTAVVSGAAGAVGSVAGQIALLCGCRVVGTAGSDEKCTYLTDDLGFDSAINYRETSNLESAVAGACPDGVDVYFDNVGGPITDAVVDQINERARIAICGQISQYDTEDDAVGPRKLWKLVEKKAKMEGFLLPQFRSRFDEAYEKLRAWERADEITYRETITDGIENGPDALIGLFEGRNVGKQLLKVGE